MPELPQKKVGIVACSGEEIAEGSVTRQAALKVLEELRPDDTVTICLPLFLAGGQGDCNLDGSIDVSTHYRAGRMVQREILNPDVVIALSEDPTATGAPN